MLHLTGGAVAAMRGVLDLVGHRGILRHFKLSRMHKWHTHYTFFTMAYFRDNEPIEIDMILASTQNLTCNAVLWGPSNCNCEDFQETVQGVPRQNETCLTINKIKVIKSNFHTHFEYCEFRLSIFDVFLSNKTLTFSSCLQGSQEMMEL